MRVRVPSLHQAILGDQLGVLQLKLNSDIIYLELVRFYRLRAQSYKTASLTPPHSTCPSQVQAVTCALTTSYRSEVPVTPSLSLINLLEWLAELRETFCLLDHRFITKAYNSGTARWKKYTGQGSGKGLGASVLSLGTSLPKSPGVHQL